MNLIFFLLISCALIGGVEVTKRTFSLSSNITRRITHIGAALIAAAAPLFLSKIFIVTACLLFAVVMFFARRMPFLSSIHSIERRSLGDVFLPLGEAISALIFLPHSVTAFQYGVLVMGISDALAGLIGERYGKHTVRLFGNRRSLEGSATFLISTLIITAFFAPVFDFQILVVALVLTSVEFFMLYGLDNLVLPILGAFLFQILM